MSILQVEQINTESQQQHADVFPLIYAKTTRGDTLVECIKWVEQNRRLLVQKLATHGAILFRDFPLIDDNDFDAFLSAFNLPNFTYADSLSNAVRHNRTSKVFTANEAPPSVSIYLHHEMAQTPIYPAKLFFFCELAAEQGGATPLCRSDLLLEKLEQRLPDFIENCEKLGVRYSNIMPLKDDPKSGQGRSWSSTLSVDNKVDAEAKLQSLSYEWQWQKNETLKVTTPVLPAIKTLKNGRRVFFNQLIAAFRGWKDSRNKSTRSICFGDGSEICQQDMAVAIDLGDELSYDMQWHTGDIVLLDNHLVMHGRRPFTGERRVLAALVAAS
ncbi:MAG: alpha-ketoglutarate-dependent taurine dioxygenase [Flavobacterium sp.]|jgi:alpha-ketoglutarate-dependent taurine dioxygenase